MTASAKVAILRTGLVFRHLSRRVVSCEVPEKAPGAPSAAKQTACASQRRHKADFRAETKICDGLPDTTGNFRRLASTT